MGTITRKIQETQITAKRTTDIAVMIIAFFCDFVSGLRTLVLLDFAVSFLDTVLEFFLFLSIFSTLIVYIIKNRRTR